MSLLTESGFLWVRDGKLLTLPDDCCCGCQFCSGSGPVDCSAFGNYSGGSSGPCFGGVTDAWTVQVSAGWTEVVPGQSKFAWDLALFGAGTTITLRGEHQFGEVANCGEVLGAWSIGTLGSLFEFTSIASAGNPATPCSAAAATVTISRSGDGYLFDVAGVASNPAYIGGFCAGCSIFNQGWLAL